MPNSLFYSCFLLRVQYVGIVAMVNRYKITRIKQFTLLVFEIFL